MQPSESSLTRAINWAVRHWLLFFNLFVATYVMLPIAAPLFMATGFELPARMIYTLYTPTCHQMAFRSFFIGGDQIVYPRALAGTDFNSFESYASTLPDFEGVSLDGLQPDLMAAARRFTGTVEMGYKTAICQRDLGIFGFLLVGGLLYGLLRNRMNIKPLPILAFIIIGMGPIGLDGFSQLFGYFQDAIPFFEILPMRESPPWLRTITGAWFGFCVAWLALPHLDRGMNEGD